MGIQIQTSKSHTIIMSVKELRKSRDSYNWNIGNDNSRFIVETNDLFEFIKQLRDIDTYYADTHQILYNNINAWETRHYHNIKTFLLDQESSKIQLFQHFNETTLGKFQYPNYQVDDLVKMTTYLKTDLTSIENELVDKYNSVASIQKNLVKCYLNLQQAREKQGIKINPPPMDDDKE